MDHAIEFQNRRRRALRRSVPWIVAGVLMTAAVIVTAELAPADWVSYASQAALGFVFLSVAVRIGYIANEELRCPKCKESIWIVGDQYVLDPKACPKCGTALK